MQSYCILSLEKGVNSFKVYIKMMLKEYKNLFIHENTIELKQQVDVTNFAYNILKNICHLTLNTL